MTNLECFRKYGDNWKRMDEIDLRAYIELLILAVCIGPETRLHVVSGQRVEGQLKYSQECYDLISVSQDLQDV